MFDGRHSDGEAGRIGEACGPTGLGARMTGDGDDADDALDGLVLDEEFVRAAKVSEASAVERSARASRIRRQHERVQRSQAASSSVGAPRGSSWVRRNLLPLTIFVGVVIGTLVVGNWSTLLARLPGGSASHAAAAAPTPSAAATAPPPGVGEAPQPLGHPAALTVTSSSYRFLFSQPGSARPVTYDPCRSIHYVVRPDHAPAGGLALIQSAVAQISQATGLRFVYDGSTTEVPANDRPDYQPDRYGQRWAPVLVAWETPQEQPSFASSTVGLGGSDYWQVGDERTYVTGTVQLSSQAISAILARPATRPLAEAIILHEFGHLVGLDHVTDPRQIMFPESQLVTTTLGAGDRTGLAQLGSGPCQPRL